MTPKADPLKEQLGALSAAHAEPQEKPKSLQDLLEKKMTKEETTGALRQLLPKLDPSVSLSLEEIECLEERLPLLSLFDASYYLPQGMFERIVKDSFHYSRFACLFIFLKAINSYDLSGEKLTSFLKGFEAGQDPQKADVQPKIIQGDPLSQLLDYLITDHTTLTRVERHLKDQSLKATGFIQCIFESAVKQCGDDPEKNAPIYDKAIRIFQNADLAKERSALILQILCRVKSVDLLVRLLKLNDKDQAIRAILDSNPPKLEDPDDHFFDQLVDKFEEKHVTAAAAIILKQPSLKRKEILFF